MVWKEGIEPTKMVYQLTARFPSDEKIGLTSQCRRTVASIPCNLAEGQARHPTGEFIQFVSHAEGYAAKVDTQLHLATELGFVPTTNAVLGVALIDEIRRMLNSLRRRLRKTR